MRASIAVVLLGPILVGAGAFAITYAYGRHQGMIEVPSVIDLGVQEQGRKVKAAVLIHNRRREPLRLTDFDTSCGCLTVGVQQNGVAAKVTDLTVAPGDTAQLIVGLAARGHPGDHLREFVTFSTNDPRRRTVQLELRAEVQGVIRARPATLALGRLLGGEKVTRRVHLQDLGRKLPFSLATIRSSQPTAIKVLNIERTQAGDSRDGSEKDATGKELYAFDVQITAPLQPGPLYGVLQVIGDDNVHVATVTITADVISNYSLTPASVVLPRNSSSGPLYEAECVCASPMNQPFKLTPKYVPPHLRILLMPANSLSRYKVRIECPLLGQTPVGRADILLTASGEGLSETVTLPIHIWQSE